MQSIHAPKTPRILVVDDDQNWLDILSSKLTKAGYAVDTAATVKEALGRINHTLYHLITLDIRLNDGDPSNHEGMQLLNTLNEHGITSVTNVFLLSAFGTLAQAREAFRRYSAVDFVDKITFDSYDFLQNVAETLNDTTGKSKFKIGFGLKIVGDGYHPRKLVTNLKINETRLNNTPENEPILRLLEDELDDLFRRLFPTARELLINKLGNGFSGAGVVLVRPLFEDGSGQRMIVKFGDRHAIDEERANFTTHVLPYEQANLATNIFGNASTVHLGGISYTFVGTNDIALNDFGEFYLRQTSTPVVLATLDHLFNETCQQWYTSRSRELAVDLHDYYWTHLGLDGKRAEVEALIQPYVHGDQLMMTLAEGEQVTLVNPTLHFDTPLYESTFESRTHGDLNERNILIDASHRCWLIDFRGTGVGHIMRDLAELDMSIRLELLKHDHATLAERHQLETALMSVRTYGDLKQVKLDSDNPLLNKAFACCVELRRTAQEKAGRRDDHSMREYYGALFYFTANAIRFKTFEQVQREHAILSSSLLAKRLFT